ncbi:sigma-70 family RNA polymerase sigma factor [Metasolibacillus sp.]|uniref:RNA polymerase sigma factor n=1 Tax=Metasolibacillus sp. TaxID=2703680 RepID=UPI0025D11E44|nr:sigma-70 family RNA polymerase sigma factor [Metasolibacillus sp.]MCT6925378.1 sigma-70 family RNA polymerase sigma factor [Metasolibacillus sp.]MCT6941594.1 sigma-70 family RNA polymerase sigma factor [Metasolibacillus sp.]
MEQIVEQYGEYLYHMSYLYVKDKQLAEEITQDVLLTYMRQHEKFRGESSLKTYLTKIAIHRCYDELRKMKRKKLLHSLLLKKEKKEPSIEDTYMKQESYATLLDKVLQLPLHYREIIILHYYEEFEVKEIAQILNESENTVRTKLRRAREILKNDPQLEEIYQYLRRMHYESI